MAKEIRAEDIRYTYDTRGYMMYYKGKPIGGAGIDRSAKGCRSNLKLFRELAEVTKRNILAGYEQRMQDEIRKIQQEEKDGESDCSRS